MCIPFQTINPPTEGSKKAVKFLQMLAIAELVVVLLKLVVVKDSGAFFELFIVFILYQSWATLNYCSCVIFVLWCLYQEIMIFVIFGTRVQNNQPFFGSKPITGALVVEFILFFYYAVAAYVAFLAYKYKLPNIEREFKILQFEMGGGYVGQDDEQPQYQQQPAYYQPQQAAAAGPSYQPRAQAQPQAQVQGGFQAFQGRGVALG